MDMDDRALLKEKITIDFVEKYDNLGNLWKGMCVTISFKEDEKLKGAIYKSYYLTQPGLPILCTFYQFENNTGECKSDITWISASLNTDDDAKNTMVKLSNPILHFL